MTTTTTTTTTTTAALALALASCSSADVAHDRLACGPASSDTTAQAGSSDSGAGSDSTSGGSSTTDGSTSTDGSSSTSGGNPSALPSPTGACPAITDGVVQICPEGYDCRPVLVHGADEAAGGPLVVHWHGTYGSPDAALVSSSAGVELAAMADDSAGVLVLPYADPDAATTDRGNAYPYPWWRVCDPGAIGCDRDDDIAIGREAIACVLEAGLVDADRVSISGYSAGGVHAAHQLAASGYLAGVVTWSGGVEPELRPTTPPSNTAAVLALHGGAADAFNGFDFREASEGLAADVEAAGGWALLCDHQGGHVDAMAAEGAEFVRLATASGAHPWAAGLPADWWTVSHWCYAPGAADPNGGAS